MSNFLKGYILGSVVMLVASILGSATGVWLANSHRRKHHLEIPKQPVAEKSISLLTLRELQHNAMLGTLLAHKAIFGNKTQVVQK